MANPLPLVPISPDRLSYLLAALLVYQQFRLRKTPPSVERAYTLMVLESLLPRLGSGIREHEGDLPLLLTVDDVQVMKNALATLIDRLNRKPSSRASVKELTSLKELKNLLDQHFSETQD